MFSKQCRYANADSVLLDSLIRDQFIVGLNNIKIQSKILELDDPHLSFEDTIQFAIRSEFRLGAQHHAKDGFTEVKLEADQDKDGNRNEKEQFRSKKKTKNNFSQNKYPHPSKIYACNFCSSAFRHERNLFRHYKKNHQDEDIEGRIVCKEVGCNQPFFSKRGWKRHRSLVHGHHSDDENVGSDDGKEQNDECSGLVHNTTDGSMLTNVSTEAKKNVSDGRRHRYCCSYCQARFKHERNLTKHYKTSHSDIEIQGRIKCKFSDCGAVFFSSLGLRQHYTKCHLDLKDMSDLTKHENTYRSEVLVRKDEVICPSNEPMGSNGQIQLREVDSLYTRHGIH